MATSVVAAALAAGTTTAARLGREGLVVGAVVGAVSGAVAGANRVYDWRSTRGRMSFVLDHTWALLTTTTGMLALGLNRLLGDPGLDTELSERRNRLVHRRGFVLRRGFAVTFGYVVNGAGASDGSMPPSRRALVEQHEDVHVWQARTLGPLYAVGYVSWTVVGAMVATGSWIMRRPGPSLVRRVDAYAYYRNPFEWYAYSRDGNWPPRAVEATRVWRRPFPGSNGRATVRESSGNPTAPR